MKKLLLSICIIVSTVAFAQISVTMTAPTNGTQVTGGTAFIVSFYLTNNGPTLMSTDSIGVQFLQNGVPLTFSGGGSIIIIGHDTKNTNDTVMRVFNLTIPTVSAGTNFCTKAVVWKNKTPIFYNSSCAWLNVGVGVNEISNAAQSVKVYPNPAKDVINFSIDGNIAKTITVLDITGRTIEVVKVANNDTQINIGEYRNGIYLYQIKSETGELVKSGKFNVSK